MPSDSIAGFLDEAQAVRILFPEQVEELIRQPDVPHTDLSKLCEYLLSRGVLTRFQADAIRESRGQELTFAGYPIVDCLGPCPGGIAYKALHPTLRTPLVLRRLKTEWLSPLDNGASFVTRARAFGMSPHPNGVLLLDAGFHRDELFVVIDQPTGAADLETLSHEIGGAMPSFLAAEYGRAIASMLRSLHERGGVHGDVRPANLLVAPLMQIPGSDGSLRRRPAPDAVVRLAEIGLVPIRPAASEQLPDLASLPYLPPERVDGNIYDSRGDIYGLGATLYFLLSGRVPFIANDSNDILNLVCDAKPVDLAELRPDLPRELIELVSHMMEKHPDHRPQTAYEVEVALRPFCRAETVTAQPIPPHSAAVVTDPQAHLEEPALIATPLPQPTDDGDVDTDFFAAVNSAGESAVRKRAYTTSDRRRTRLLLLLGAALHITAVGVLIAWAFGAFK